MEIAAFPTSRSGRSPKMADYCRVQPERGPDPPSEVVGAAGVTQGGHGLQVDGLAEGERNLVQLGPVDADVRHRFLVQYGRVD